MTPSDVLVIVGGVAAIVWVNWYFLLAGRASAGHPAAERGEVEGEEAGI